MARQAGWIDFEGCYGVAAGQTKQEEKQQTSHWRKRIEFKSCFLYNNILAA